MGEAHIMEIFDTVTDLTENAINFWTTHFTCHDDAEQVIRGIFHDLVVKTTVCDNVDGLDDIGMFESRAEAEFCCDLFLVLFLCLSGPFRAKLFDGIDDVSGLVTGLDESDRATSAAAEDAAELSVFLGEMNLSSVSYRKWCCRGCTGNGN